MGSTHVAFPGLNIDLVLKKIAIPLPWGGIYWYGIIIAAGFLLALLYTYRRAPKFGLKGDDFIDLLIIAIPVSIICTRAYYVIFNFQYYKDDLLSVFRIWDGGLAVYGGIIGAVVATLFVARKKKIHAGAFLDLGGLGLLIGQAVGRWGNFVNGEAYGSQTTLPWRMRLYTAAEQYIEVHPTFLYESLWNALGFALLHFYSKKRKFDGEVFLLYVAWYGLGRALIEGLRTDSLYLFNTGVRVSQLLAILSCIAAAVLLVLFWTAWKERTGKTQAELEEDKKAQAGHKKVLKRIIRKRVKTDPAALKAKIKREQDVGGIPGEEPEPEEAPPSEEKDGKNPPQDG